jgi:uncharacterized lipoprotein
MTETGPSKRRLRAAAVAAVVALVGLSACTSDPGPKRVARDIIEAQFLENPELDKECLLAELDKYSSDDLTAIDENLDADNSDRNAEGEAALAAFELSLGRCI